MKFMVSWKIPPGSHKPAAEAFLKNAGAPPEGLKILGRWHAPGSGYGWVLSESEDMLPITQHMAEWANYLELEITPVIDDETAGAGFAHAYGA